MLAQRLQSLYCTEHAFLELSVASRELHAGGSGAAAVPGAAADEVVDNADQRMTMDLITWSHVLRSVLATFGAAPFKIVFYTWWMRSYTGWQPVIMVYLFFLLGSMAQRCSPPTSPPLPHHPVTSLRNLPAR